MMGAMAAGGLLAAEFPIESVSIGGAGAVVLTLLGYLLKELRRKDEGVWAIIADRDRQIEALTTDRDYWRNLVMDDGTDRRRRPR